MSTTIQSTKNIFFLYAQIAAERRLCVKTSVLDAAHEWTEVLTMADLIDRDELLKDLRSECPESDVCINGEPCIECIVNLQPAVNRWISVEDALPDALQNVLVCTGINTVTVAWINGEGWTFADTGGGHTENWGFDDVKYWMPLPELPKEDES